MSDRHHRFAIAVGHGVREFNLDQRQQRHQPIHVALPVNRVVARSALWSERRRRVDYRDGRQGLPVERHLAVVLDRADVGDDWSGGRHRCVSRFGKRRSDCQERRGGRG